MSVTVTPAVPQKGTLLSAREVDDTEFASTYAAYDALPETDKAEIASLRVVHSFRCPAPRSAEKKLSPEPRSAKWELKPSSTSCDATSSTPRTVPTSLIASPHTLAVATATTPRCSPAPITTTASTSTGRRPSP